VQNYVLNVIWAKEVSDEHHCVHDEEAAGYRQWGGKPFKVLARGVVQRIHVGLFRAKIA
jgi:hypothetical protein